MNISRQIIIAKTLHEEGQLEDALQVYSETFNLLVKKAREYAKEEEVLVESKNGKKDVVPEFFQKTTEYFKKDEYACIISNNMGIIFMEMGNYPAAKELFEQAINLTPKNYDFLEPFMFLDELEQM